MQLIEALLSYCDSCVIVLRQLKFLFEKLKMDKFIHCYLKFMSIARAINVYVSATMFKAVMPYSNH